MPKLLNTFQVDAECKVLLEPSSVEELLSFLPAVKAAQEQQKLLIIGRGSNLLPVGNYDGTVLRSRIMGRNIEVDGNDVYLTCGSGETVDDVIEWCVEQGYYGLENLSLIPGEVGASAVQNIGAYGTEAKDYIHSLKALDIATGDIVEIMNKDCNYAYRQSRFKGEWKNKYFITEVTYKLSRIFNAHIEYGNITHELQQQGVDCPTPRQVRDVIINIRNAKLPDYNVEGNAGSFFMNPIVKKEVFEKLLSEYPSMPHYHVDDEHEKIPAGWMIEQCGWKGRSVGNAGVHSKQALVLVNHGGAQGKDVLELCEMVRADVKKKFNIDIYPEVNIIGS